MNKFTYLKLIAIVLIMFNLLGFVSNNSGIILYAMLCGYYVIETFVNHVLVNKNKLNTVFQGKILSQLFIFELMFCLTYLLIYLNNDSSISFWSSNFILFITFSVEFVYLTPLALFASIGMYYLFSYLIYFITLKYIKSFNFLIITLIIILVSSFSVGMFFNSQMYYFSLLSIGSLIGIIINFDLVNKIIKYLTKFRYVFYVITVLSTFLLILNISLLFNILLIILMILISHIRKGDYEKINIIDKYFYIIPIVMYVVTHYMLVVYNLNSQDIIITLLVLSIITLLTLIIYYVFYICIYKQFKIKYLYYVLFIVLITLTTSFSLTIDSSKNTNSSTKLIDEYFLVSQNINVLISNVHESYVINNSESSIVGTNTLYISDINSDNDFESKLNNKYPNIETDINSDYSFSDAQMLIDKYSSKYASPGNFIIVDLKSTSGNYSEINNVCTSFENDYVFFVTNINQDETNVLFERAALENDNCHVIDFAYDSLDKDEYYTNNEYDLNNIGEEAYDNFIYNEISRIVKKENNQ